MTDVKTTGTLASGWYRFTATKDGERLHERIPAMSLIEARNELINAGYTGIIFDSDSMPAQAYNDVLSAASPLVLYKFLKALSVLPNDMSLLDKCGHIYEDIENGKYPDNNTTADLMNFVQDLAAMIMGDDR
jgi:hypothetical protein